MNEETAYVRNWINIIEAEREYWLEEAKAVEFDIFKLADKLKESYESTADEYVFDASNKGLISEDSVYSDLMRSALSRVNWDEIAKAICEESKELS